MKVSIIVPVFNAEKYLRECIESVIAQTLGDYELILVNDGSTDSSAAICDEYSSLDSRIQVFHKPNDGPASAKNFGMERAQGEYIIFLNADDFWTNKDCLDTLVNIADSTKADIVKGEFKVIGSDGKEIRKERHRKILDKKILSRKLFFGKCLDGEFSCFQFLIRRESMSGLTFDESFTFDEDAELASRYFRKKVKCAYSAKCFYAVRLHSHSLTASYKNSNLNCAFSLPLYFFRCSHGLRAGLRRTYRRYSVMLYYRALVMMSEGKYYDDRSTIIKHQSPQSGYRAQQDYLSDAQVLDFHQTFHLHHGIAKGRSLANQVQEEFPSAQGQGHQQGELYRPRELKIWRNRKGTRQHVIERRGRE